ncbi:hypothetical protein CPB84DRAFT_294310 [Gymnopilus junonius]|uniref:Uncharacterized protein n=1 Tax=Gymnopilus junonius TaxID=109634 RepID=A0A9P5TQE5_GYMJU|nr:hypothetical protein CPB84DRAFT_294310 [Gymnopilus junonius]
MSELIRRANSMPGSPFPAAPPSSSKVKPLTARTPHSTAYSPYLKSSRSLLSRIAPLHPNRRTPPPPPPPPPPRKKTKKELELEEKWEEELVESVGGVEAWAVMQDEERKELRKAKWARELGDWGDALVFFLFFLFLCLLIKLLLIFFWHSLWTWCTVR